MRDSLALSPARAAFERIVDYAGLYPPACLPIAEAAAEYERERAGPHAWMLGRFIVPATRIGELESLLKAEGPVPLSVLLDGEIVSTARTTPQACEVALRIDNELGLARAAIHAVAKTARTLAPALPLAVEIPATLSAALLAEAMDALAEAGFAAKLRCGGVTEDAVPSVEHVAAFMRAAMHERVPVKATAGLHHPVRHFNESAGFTMHGFLNLLAAACFAGECDSAVATQIVAEEDRHAFAFDERGFRWRDRIADEARLRDVRRTRLLAFGSCSFREPLEDLLALGLLPEG